MDAHSSSLASGTSTGSSTSDSYHVKIRHRIQQNSGKNQQQRLSSTSFLLDSAVYTTNSNSSNGGDNNNADRSGGGNNNETNFQRQRRRSSANIIHPTGRRRSINYDEIIKLNQLQFDSLGLYGREKELQILEEILDCVKKGESDIIEDAAARSADEMLSSSSKHRQEEQIPQQQQQQRQEQQRQERPSRPQHHEVDSHQEQQHHKIRSHHNYHSKQVVLLSGHAGSGKSTLAESLRQKVARKAGGRKEASTTTTNDDGGLFIKGKFDYYLRDKPFTGIIEACGEICKELQSMKESSRRGLTNGSCMNQDKGGHSRLDVFEQIQSDLIQNFDISSIDSTQEGDDQLVRESSSSSSLLSSTTTIRFFPGLEELLLQPQDEVIAGETGSTKHEEGLDHYDDNHHDGGKQRAEPPPPHGSMEDKYRFMHAFNVFVKTICKYMKPVVLVLDDLQWADSSSLEMIESVIHDVTINNLMIVGIYRSDEVTDAHLLSKMIRDLRSRCYCGHEEGQLHSHTKRIGALPVDFTELFIGDLDVSSVNSMIQSILSTDDNSKTSTLAALCHRKTHGNPFYLIHFITLLEEMKLVEFDLGSLEWTWDLDDIERYTKSTDNVVTLLQSKMVDTLSNTVRLVLHLASFLGSTFDYRTLELIWIAFRWMAPELSEKDVPENIESSGEDLLVSLDTCQELGFLECVDAGVGSGQNDKYRTYRWVHDNIQEAALSILGSESDRKKVKHKVGEVLFAKLSAEELQRRIFIVANLLNVDDAVTLSRTEMDPIQIANVNLQAAEHAVLLSAFESASTYARQAMTVLSLEQNCWSMHYDLCLTLYSLAAEVENCLGNSENVEVYCNEVLERCKDLPIKDTFRAYHVLLDSMSNRNRPGDAAQLCLAVLRRCGCSFPKSHVSILWKVIVNIVKIKASMMKSGEAADAIEKLPILKDQWVIEKMKLVDKLGTYCYLSESDILPLAIFRNLQWTMKHGISEASPSAFASTGLILAGVLDDLKGGELYAKLALLVFKRLGSKKVEARTMFVVHSFILHWIQPAQHMLKPLLRSYEVGLQTGDTESAMWAIMTHIVFAFLTGRPLDSLESDYRTYSSQMSDLKRQESLFNCKCIGQVILNLMGKSHNTTKLTGEAADEEILHEIAKKDKFKRAVLQVHQCIVHSYFGEFEFCAQHSLTDGDNVKVCLPGTPLVALDTFHRALGLLAVARKNNRQSCRLYLKAASKPIATIRRWLEQGNPNVKHYKSLLDAESAAAKGKVSVARKRYEVAVVLAAKNGFLHDAALASERYGRYLFETSKDVESSLDHDEATFRIKQAVKYYSDWGAHVRSPNSRMSTQTCGQYQLRYRHIPRKTLFLV